MASIDEGDRASRAVGGWGSMPDDYITSRRVLNAVDEVAQQIDYRSVSQVWADFREMIEAQIIIGFYATPIRTNGEPYKRHDMPRSRLEAIFAATELRYPDGEATLFCHEMRRALL